LKEFLENDDEVIVNNVNEVTFTFFSIFFFS